AVEAPPRVDGLLDHLARLRLVGDIAVVGDRRAAALLDQLDREVRVVTRAFTGDARAEVVHHHSRAVPGQLERMPTADAVPRAGDDRDLSVQQCHQKSLCRWFTVWRSARGARTSRPCRSGSEAA